MILPEVLLFVAASLVESVAAPVARTERIVVVLGENDPSTSLRVLRQMGSCSDGLPVAVVSSFDRLRLVQDFRTDRDAVLGAVLAPRSNSTVPSADARFSLAARLPAEERGDAAGWSAALETLAKALAPVGRTTAVVLISPRIAAVSRGVTGATEAQPPYYRDIGLSTAVPLPVLEARQAVREAGLAIVGVNAGGPYDPGLKALTEIPRGTYLETGQRGFAKAFSSAVCSPKD